MNIYDEVTTPSGNKGVIWLFFGYPETIAYIEVYPTPEEGWEYIQLYDHHIMDVAIKQLNKFSISDLVYVSAHIMRPIIEIGEIKIDKERCEVIYKGEKKHIPKKQFEILSFLAQRPQVFVSREQIIEQVWNNKLKDTKTLNVHVCNLRKIISEIETIPGVGYRLAI